MASLDEYRKKKAVSGPGWFKLDNGQTKRVFILNEFSDIKRAVIHVSPENFRKHAECTALTEECYGCEKKTFAWAPRVKIYLPVWYNSKVEIFTQGTGNNSILWDLGDHYEKYGTIRQWFDFSRKGEGKRAAYSAVAVESPEPKNLPVSHNLNKHINYIEYTEQKKYFN